jgi:tRNA A-37 threonylcarbamoyl transferase component Bud32
MCAHTYIADTPYTAVTRHSRRLSAEAGYLPGGEADAEVRLVAGRYRLLSELGRGGMGVVWRAADELVGRPVAVKELRPPQGLSRADRETYGLRALAEARSVARIDHPAAVRLYDVLPATAADDAVYLIMELVEGPTLAQLIERGGPLPGPQVAGLGLQLVSVLAAAHGLGIVHRDVKPANIIITAGGQAKLTDFGIAHTVGEARLTRSGVMGTRAYLAPELFDAAPITAAADLWSLGATLYAAAAGRGPFERASTGATLRAILIDDVPAPGCEPVLAAAISALLQRDPARRATLDQARAQLQHAAAGPATPPPAAPAAAKPADAPSVRVPVPPEPAAADTGTVKVARRDPPVSTPAPAAAARDVLRPVAPVKIKERRWPNWSVVLLIGVVAVLGIAGYGYFHDHHTTRPRPTAGDVPAHSHSALKSPAPAKQVVKTAAGYVHLRLVVTAGKVTWAGATTSGGRVLFQGDVTGGSQEVWTEKHQITLALGNPGAATLYLNGKKMPFSETTRPITVVCTPTTCTTA